MLVMPMNRHMTWGDRQADAARDRNLEKLKKLAAMAPPPESPAEDAAKTASKPAAKTAAKKSNPAKAAAKKKTKK